MRRLLTFAFGIGAGALVGAAVVRRADAARRALAPASLAEQAGRAAGGALQRARDFQARARKETAAAEAELRARYGADTRAPGA